MTFRFSVAMAFATVAATAAVSAQTRPIDTEHSTLTFFV